MEFLHGEVTDKILNHFTVFITSLVMVFWKRFMRMQW
jgi:hypothetical protein